MTTTEALFTPSVAIPAAPTPQGASRPSGEDGVTFKDLLDVINPLQHLPVVSTVYRRLTGDTLAPSARLIGGTLYGGPLGGMLAFVNVLVEAGSGKDIGDNVATALLDDAAGKPATSVAQAEAFTAARGDSRPAPADRPIVGVEFAAAAEAPPAGTRGSSAYWTPLIDSGTIVGASASPDRGFEVGAAAADGGWFSEVMLSALRKYQAPAAGVAVPDVARTI